MDILTLALAKSKSGSANGTITTESITNALGYKPADQEDVSQLSSEIDGIKDNGTDTGEGVPFTIKQAFATILDAVLIDTNKQTSASEALAKIKEWAYGGTTEVIVSQTGSVLTLSNVTDITSITQTGTTLALA